MIVTITTHTRNTEIANLVALLQQDQLRKIDVVAQAKDIESRDGVIRIKYAEPLITENGVTTEGLFTPNGVFDEGIADKLKIPLAYVRRLRADRPDLYDANVNGWLHGRKAKVRYSEGAQEVLREGVPGDSRKFMLRCYSGDDGGAGVARALLSNRYGVIDNFDVLVAALQGIREADPNAKVVGCDLTDRRMYVRVQSLDVSVLAPALLDGYHSPYTGLSGADNRQVFAGFLLTNSEVGNGRFSITPRVVFEVCDNGMTITKDAIGRAHIGRAQEESVVQWSQDTTSKELALITAQAHDSVATFLSEEYLQSVVDDVTEKAGGEIKNSAEAVKVVTKKLNYSDEVAAGILDMFIKGGQTTAGGVMQAVTAYAQQVTDADLAADLEADALKALDFAAAL